MSRIPETLALQSAGRITILSARRVPLRCSSLSRRHRHHKQLTPPPPPPPPCAPLTAPGQTAAFGIQIQTDPAPPAPVTASELPPAVTELLRILSLHRRHRKSYRIRHSRHTTRHAPATYEFSVTRSVKTTDPT